MNLWADPGVTYQGQVREVSPGAEPVTRTYTVKVSIVDADAQVRLGMTANVLLGSTLAEQMIELPLTALYRKDGAAAVWVVDVSTATVNLVPVRLGEYHENTFTVLDGLKAGDLVVTAGVHKLVPGQKVRSRRLVKGVNLSEWALRHQTLTLYLMVALLLAGVFAYFKLGRAEDPDFTVKVMVVRTLWPGATAS